jgi:hypothetical protein
MTDPSPPEPYRLTDERTLLERLDRAHRMSCSDPIDPTRRTLYSEARDALAVRDAEDAALRERVEAFADALTKEADAICPEGVYDKKDKAWRIAHVRRRVADDLREMVRAAAALAPESDGERASERPERVDEHDQCRDRHQFNSAVAVQCTLRAGHDGPHGSAWLDGALDKPYTWPASDTARGEGKQ